MSLHYGILDVDDSTCRGYMASVKSVQRHGRTYYYLDQAYRWGGRVRKKQVYLGLAVPPDLSRHRAALEQAVWAETYLRLFDRIRRGYWKRLRVVPRSVQVSEGEDFVLRFTYDTNRIEGSTLTLDDTRKLLARGVSPAGKPYSDAVESKRHADLARRLFSKPEPLDLSHLLKWHKELFGETKADISGRLRDFEVKIGDSEHLPPSPIEVRPILIELLRRTSRNSARVHPVQRAGEFHFWFENIHPFGDGNGRIGRLAINVLLA